MFPGIILGMVFMGVIAAIAGSSKEKKGTFLSLGEATDDGEIGRASCRERVFITV